MDLIAALNLAVGDLNNIRRIDKALFTLPSSRGSETQSPSRARKQALGYRPFSAASRSAFGVAQVPFARKFTTHDQDEIISVHRC